MIAQHTPGRLTVRENGDANSYAIMDDAGQWLLHMLHNGRQTPPTQSENLRRLAACWNYCEGLDTEGMERSVEMKRPANVFIDESIKKELDLLAQRDALLEALRPFSEATLTDAGHIIGLMREDFERARAAIAKATGGAT